ncbi:Uncharacterized protein FWK35_00021457, partial [Aphis craccivora]
MKTIDIELGLVERFMYSICCKIKRDLVVFDDTIKTSAGETKAYLIRTNDSLISVLFITIIEMTSVFHKTLRPILILSKCIGLIDSTYTMEPTGLLVHNVKSLFHICFEIA